MKFIVWIIEHGYPRYVRPLKTSLEILIQITWKRKWSDVKISNKWPLTTEFAQNSMSRSFHCFSPLYQIYIILKQKKPMSNQMCNNQRVLVSEKKKTLVPITLYMTRNQTRWNKPNKKAKFGHIIGRICWRWKTAKIELIRNEFARPLLRVDSGAVGCRSNGGVDATLMQMQRPHGTGSKNSGDCDSGRCCYHGCPFFSNKYEWLLRMFDKCIQKGIGIKYSPDSIQCRKLLWSDRFKFNQQQVKVNIKFSILGQNISVLGELHCKCKYLAALNWRIWKNEAIAFWYKL